MKTTIAILIVFALTAAACGDESAQPDADSLPTVAGACEEGTVECDDTPDVGDPFEPGEPEPIDGLDPDTGSGMLVNGGLTIEEALASDASGPLAIQGFYVHDGVEGRLCSALAESFPPQCSGASVLFDGTGLDPDLLQGAQGVTWTDDFVSLIGELVDGRLIATPTSI